ncbi:MAG: DNA-binding protein, partial [Mesorhizobium sp.]
HLGGPAILAYKLFPEAELSLALGGTNVIHAAVLAGDAGRAVQMRMVALDRYRGGSPDDLARLAAVADEDDAAEDME